MELVREVLLEPLIQSPSLPLYYQRLGTLLAEEQRRRQQFYETVAEDQKAEFINGEVIVHSPVKLEHEFASNNLNKLLGAYVTLHDLGYAGHEKMLITFTRNDYEPDVCFWRQEKAAQFAAAQMRFPVPDFIAEVLSPSTAAIDRGVKLDDYAAHGVQEYWIVDPARQNIEQYVLETTGYILRQKTNSGLLRSVAVPGFEIPATAVFDRQSHLAALRALLQTEAPPT